MNIIGKWKLKGMNTLVTCSYNEENGRFVVVARQR